MSAAGRSDQSANGTKGSGGSGAPAIKPFAIKLGSGTPRPNAARPPAPSKRHKGTLNDDSDSDDGVSSAHQEVTSFDAAAGGAISAQPKAVQAARVIASIPNKDWRAEARRLKGTNLLPPEVVAARNTANDKTIMVEEKPTYGLIINTMEDEPHADGTPDTLMPDAPTNGSIAKTEDDAALQALLGQGEQNSTMVIAAAAENTDWRLSRSTEADAFKSDVRNRPDQASLEDYDAVPIDGFGAAMLRGMGWKDGEGIGKGKRKLAPTISKVPGKRQALLGIGAKPTAGAPEDFGVWGVKKGRIEKTEAYNPLVLKDKTTGELITEDELKARREIALQLTAQESGTKERDSDSRNGHKKRDRDDDRRHKAVLSIKDREDREGSRSRDRNDSDRERHRSSRDKDDRDKYRSSRDDRDRDRDRDRRKDREDLSRHDRKDSDRRERRDDRPSDRHRSDRGSDSRSRDYR
jgi:hypothetical protein